MNKFDKNQHLHDEQFIHSLLIITTKGLGHNILDFYQEHGLNFDAPNIKVPNFQK